jgi:hypothetical protein
MTFARLVTHYWSHDCFLEDGILRREARLLARIPAVLVHGRFDVSSPLDTAWELSRAWPASDLIVVDECRPRSAPRIPARAAACITMRLLGPGVIAATITSPAVAIHASMSVALPGLGA